MGRPIKRDEVAKLLDEKVQDALTKILREDMERYFERPFDSISEKLLLRYSETPHINFALSENEQITRRLYSPLESAKKSYCLGDFSTTFAMCGIVGEMLALLLWKIKKLRLQGKDLTEENEILLLGDTFEQLSQQRRLRICRVFRWITNEQCKKLNVIRMKRNEILHAWNPEISPDTEERLALQVLTYTFKIFHQIVGIDLKDSQSLTINPNLLRYIKSQQSTFITSK